MSPSTAPARTRPVRLLAAALVGTFLVAAAACAPAPPAGGAVRDQGDDGPAADAAVVSNDVQPGSPVYTSVAQELTAGTSGTLEHVQLQVAPHGAARPLRVAVTTVPDGWVPCDPFQDACPAFGTVLGTGSLDAAAATAGWNDVVLDAPADVVAGGRYLLVLSTDPAPLDPATGSPDPADAGWWTAATDGTGAYAGGVAARTDVHASGMVEWLARPDDLLFRTWVTPVA